ncbi:hypothetical protein [Pandoraea communis]|uniref:hypothetical protein n=1 Tax=Pandoraea communis TaxID=2508297 RepID=UPI0012408BE1|nr:hypothetical protein [Pandoraea communis]MDM8356935.1 hypothetical protein [Pandoraea communis]
MSWRAGKARRLDDSIAAGKGSGREFGNGPNGDADFADGLGDAGDPGGSDGVPWGLSSPAPVVSKASLAASILPRLSALGKCDGIEPIAPFMRQRARAASARA